MAQQHERRAAQSDEFHARFEQNDEDPRQSDEG